VKLARSRTVDAIVPIVGIDGRWYDLTPLASTVDGSLLTPESRQRIAAAARASELIEIAEPAEFAAPLEHIGKIVCIGLNYRDHAEETGATPPAEPVIFMKAPDTVVGPNDVVLVPWRSYKTDYEVELAVVIGSITQYLDSPAQSPSHIAGYAISNDVSEREFQIARGGQWDKGKNCATFNPLGPWIQTAEEITDPQCLGLRLWVNGELRQDGNTKNMIFDVAHLVWYVSQFMTLYPGDVINTGTPAGVAMGRPDEPYLRAGDVVEIEIDGLGRQRSAIGQA
jgi:2-keto-4-pentenoate hydratase/2-oxohepta-3-ene-1,7-dioic acid hydratase in catechol pathway